MKVIVEFDCIEDAVKAVSALNQQSEVQYEPIKKEWFSTEEKTPNMLQRVLGYYGSNSRRLFQITWLYEDTFRDGRIFKFWKNGTPDKWTYLITP